MRGRHELLLWILQLGGLRYCAQALLLATPGLTPGLRRPVVRGVRRSVKPATRGSTTLQVIGSKDTDRILNELSDANGSGQVASKPPEERTKLRVRLRQKFNSAMVGLRKPNAFDAEIFALAIPTLGAVLIDPCLSLVDTGYVGRLGALSLAAIGPCTAAFNFVFVTASCAFMVSTSVVVSEQRAINDIESIGRTLTLASSLSVVLGTVMAVVFYKHSAGLLSLMGAPPEVMGLAVPYLRWRATAFPANLFLLVACGAFRGMGEPKSGLVNAIVVGLVNLVLDPLLMFGCGLGVAGAAIATATAQWVGALVYLKYMWSRRKQLGLGGRSSIPGLKDMKKLVGNGGMMILRQLCNVGAWTVMASTATRMGIMEIAAHQLMLSLWMVIGFVQESLGSSGQVLVARYFGLARDAQRASERERSWDGDALRYRDIARSVAKRVLTLTVGLGLVLATGALGLFPVLLPVVCKSPEVALLVSNVFPTILYSFPMCCVVWTWDSLFYGASDFVYNAKTVAVASSCGVLGSVLSLRHGWGIRGLWVSMTYVLFGVRFLAHLWRFNSIRGPFGPSTFWNNLPVSSETSVATQRGITLAGTDISGGTDISARTTRSYND